MAMPHPAELRGEPVNLDAASRLTARIAREHRVRMARIGQVQRQEIAALRHPVSHVILPFRRAVITSAPLRAYRGLAERDSIGLDHPSALHRDELALGFEH